MHAHAQKSLASIESVKLREVGRGQGMFVDR